MKSAQRIRNVLQGKPVDRLPVMEWAAWWDQTLLRWQSEGMPADLDHKGRFDYWGLDHHVQIGVDIFEAGCPQAPGHGLGILKTEEEYEKILPYMFRDSAIDRLLQQLEAVKNRHEAGEAAVWLSMSGFFWFPRDLFGIESHLFSFYDEPDLLRRMNRDLAAFMQLALEAAFTVLTPDFFMLSEDMSYNHGPMLSKACFDEFLAPYYRQVAPLLHSHGVPLIIDTDGDVEPMIPWLMECGIDGVLPLERQSGVVVARIRSKYPEFAMIGGFDKRVMYQGEEAMREEFERLLPVMRQGRYIPSVDHQTPPHVSMDDYKIYCRLLHEYAQIACRDTENG